MGGGGSRGGEQGLVGESEEGVARGKVAGGRGVGGGWQGGESKKGGGGGGGGVSIFF